MSPPQLLTTAVVLAMFGVLSAIETPGWVMTSTLFILAAAARDRRADSPVLREELTMFA